MRLKEAKPSRLRELTEKFMESTGIGGISKCKKTSSKCARAFWLTLLIIGAFWTMYNIGKIIQRSMKMETITSVEVIYRETHEFPAVTICNENPIHCQRLFNLIHQCKAVKSLPTMYFYLYTVLQIFDERRRHDYKISSQSKP